MCLGPVNVHNNHLLRCFGAFSDVLFFEVWQLDRVADGLQIPELIGCDNEHQNTDACGGVVDRLSSEPFIRVSIVGIYLFVFLCFFDAHAKLRVHSIALITDTEAELGEESCVRAALILLLGRSNKWVINQTSFVDTLISVGVYCEVCWRVDGTLDGWLALVGLNSVVILSAKIA